jgi:diguanylate cyclase (GGDEF)-like protein
MTRMRARRGNSRRLAAADPLTGLPPRAALEAYLARRLGAGSDAGGRLAVVVLDVDGFQHINAALGYPAGDRLLVTLARRLIGRDPAIATRLGADRFAAVVRLDAAQAPSTAAARLGAAMRGPVPDDGLTVDVSAGVAVYPEHGRDAATLLRRAEHAMREAKWRGDGEIGVPAAGDSLDQVRLLADLRRAVCDPTDESIRLYYQPQVDPRTGVVVGAEAMPRWHLPDRGPIDPADLFRAAENARAAEHAGVPRLLAGRVLDDVIDQLHRWGDAVGDLRVSVNVTMHDLTGPALVDRLADRLAGCGVRPSRLQLEITEGTRRSEPRAALAVLSRVQGLGVPIALDHFGTGTASLALLRRLPLAEVKIDRSFVLGAARDEADAAVVRAVVGLAKDLGLRAVADGVEDERTWRALARTGCVVQGWYCARPMPAERLVNWIALYRNRLRPQLT